MTIRAMTCLVLLGTMPIAFGQWGLRITYQTEPGYQTDVEEDYFEQWLDLKIDYRNWHAGAKYEQFNPAKPQSIMSEDEGVWNRFISYRSKGAHVRLGTFYTMLGKGLVLKAYDYPAIGLDRRLDGLFTEYDHQYWSAKALSGKIYGLDREQNNDILGGQAVVKPWKALQLGGTYLETTNRFGNDLVWSSGFVELNIDSGSIYAEHASGESGSSATYAVVNWFIGAASILAEYKDYDRFGNADGEVIYNDPPTLVQEHHFSLWNRHNYALDAYDEVGYSLKLDTPIGESGTLTIQHSKTEFQDGYDVFQEAYGLLEWEFPGNLHAQFIAGIQEDFNFEYTNIGSEWRFPLGQRFLGLIGEVQHSESIWSSDKFDSQAMTMDLTINAKNSLSIITEHSNSTESDKSFWLGVKYGLKLGTQFDMDLFAGTRRKGKICAGGICIYSPEFEGVELRAKYRFQR